MKRFEEFTHDQFKALVRHLKKYSRFPEPERLHQIRVDIKKIKAILHVLNSTQKGFHLHKYFAPFKTIFRKAEAIREPNVMTDLLRKYHDDSTEKKVITNKEEQLIDAFVYKVPGWIKILKEEMNKIEPLCKRTSHDDLQQYVHKKRKMIKTGLYPQLSMDKIHEVRKAIKEVLYLSEIEHELKKKEIQFYDNTQDMIGQLHDNQVLLTRLEMENYVHSRAYRRARSACRSNKTGILHLAKAFYRS